MTASTLIRTATAALTPTDSQAVFRAVLDALARPGRPTRLPATGHPPALLPTLALADLGTGVCVLADRDEAERVRLATGAPSVAAERAALVTALRPISPDELRGLARGSALEPEAGALVTIAVDALRGGPSDWQLTGPGIPGRCDIAPAGLTPELVAARAEAVAGYPAGLDLLLVTPHGELIGLPRTSTVTGEVR